MLWGRIEAGTDRMSNFGRLTHTVQDFYSHSNWVELHQHVSPLPVWDLRTATLPAGAVSGTYRERTREFGLAAPTHAELNKDSPLAWFSPSGCRVVADGPNRGRTLFELGYEAALAATRIQFDRLLGISRGR